MRASTMIVMLLVLTAGGTMADPGRGRPVEQGAGTDWGRAIISAAERALIRDYYREHGLGETRRGLPPGIRKKLERGKPLPPGIAKNFPGALQARLPDRPGYAYQVVGEDVFLVELATGVIVDLIRNLAR